MVAKKVRLVTALYELPLIVYDRAKNVIAIIRNQCLIEQGSSIVSR